MITGDTKVVIVRDEIEIINTDPCVIKPGDVLIFDIPRIESCEKRENRELFEPEPYKKQSKKSLKKKMFSE